MNNKDYEINLDPPKIYKNQEVPGRRNSKKNNRNISTAEKRHRQNKKRRLKNSVRNALITIGLLLVLLAVGIVLSLTVFFKIEAIDISGSGMYSTEEITAYCSIDAGDNLFLIDKDKCAETLQEKLPYIYDVKITRKLPSTIQIEITDAVPAYTLKNEDGSCTLLDDRFKVLDNTGAADTADTVEIQNVAVINNVNGLPIEFENAETAACLNQLSSIISKLNITEATAISSDGKHNNYIVYENRITIKLGNSENLENKIYRGIAGCEKLNESNPTAKGTMDVSSGKQFYFTAE